ncbi:two-component system response regulator [Ectothiorhodospiraceae bacterium BW-2]|nr:two-component system response regulator [Ectothiorhodospiraceae bacterium BW-2]
MVRSQQTILVVDDTPNNLDLLGSILRHDYRVKTALNGDTALKIARMQPKPDMFLLDVMMPEMDGYQLCRLLKADPSTAAIPVIFVTARSDSEGEERGFALGAVDYITKPVSPPLVKARVATHLALYDQRCDLERLVQQRTVELTESRMEIIKRLGRAAEFKDNETGLHVIRMSHYARIIATCMDQAPAWVELLFLAAPMHDIGKIGIPDRILLKPGRLDAEEWAVMRRHPEYGAGIIGSHHSELIQISHDIALTHHEKWDGSGYPQGLKGEAIPLAGRICAVADVFDALTTKRPYKEAWPLERALAVIDEGRGSHFDPAVVDAFHQGLEHCLLIREQYAEQS